VLASRSVAEPLTRYHCGPSGDGAAAVVLIAEDRLNGSASRSVQVLASVVGSGRSTPGERDVTASQTTVRCAQEAYERAGIGPEALAAHPLDPELAGR
jgi:benzoylsuccinyl-CoA thiolase BbsB subunit